jgi:hypothetical protein
LLQTSDLTLQTCDPFGLLLCQPRRFVSLILCGLLRLLGYGLLGLCLSYYLPRFRAFPAAFLSGSA